MIALVIVDMGCGLDPAELRDVAEALTRQASVDFAPHYGLAATVRVASGAGDVQPGEWMLGLWPHPDVADALGYHDTTPKGQPCLHVFPPLDAQDGVPWSATASHELVEALGDPWAGLLVVGPRGLYAYETADPVESDTYTTKVASGREVALSNFVLPAWFTPPQDLTGARFDFMGLCRAPFEVRPGGYQSIFNGSAWTQVWGERTPRSYRLLSRRASRGARRARGTAHPAVAPHALHDHGSGR